MIKVQGSTQKCIDELGSNMKNTLIVFSEIRQKN